MGNAFSFDAPGDAFAVTDEMAALDLSDEPVAAPSEAVDSALPGAEADVGGNNQEEEEETFEDDEGGGDFVF